MVSFLIIKVPYVKYEDGEAEGFCGGHEIF